MKKSLMIFSSLLLGTALVFTSCDKGDDETTPPVNNGPTLYTRVGGTTMVADPAHSGQMIEQGRLTLRSVVDSAILVIAGDNKINGFFNVLLKEYTSNPQDLTGFNALSANFTDFLVDATKGTTGTYGGRSMKNAHDPAKNSRMNGKASNADFDAFVGDIGTALAKNGVTSANNAALVNDLVALLETTRKDVVQK